MLFFGDASEALTPGAIQMLVLLAVLWWVLGRAASLRLSTTPTPTRLSGVRLARDLTGLVFVWAWVFSTPALASLALGQLEGPAYQAASPRTPAPLYVIAGSGTPAQGSPTGHAQLTLAGWRRTEAAVSHWQTTGGNLLFVGGLGDPANPDETSIASTMASLALQMGVPASAIQTAGHHSGNTYQDMQAAREPVLAHKTPVYLISSAAHLPRTRAVARSLGMNVMPLPCDWHQLHQPGWRAWLPNNGGPQLWQKSLYELFGTLAYQWRGWI